MPPKSFLDKFLQPMGGPRRPPQTKRRAKATKPASSIPHDQIYDMREQPAIADASSEEDSSDSDEDDDDEDEGDPETNCDAQSKRYSSTMPHTQPSQSRSSQAPPWADRCPSPSVIDTTKIPENPRKRTPSPTGSYYPDCEGPQTISWLEIANRGFQRYMATDAKVIKKQSGKRGYAALKCPADAWQEYNDRSPRSQTNLQSLLAERKAQGDEAGICYMLSQYVDKDPSTRWTRLLPLPDPDPDHNVYSAMGTLEASRKVYVEPSALQAARDIITRSDPAPLTERNRLVLSQVPKLKEMLSRRGYELPESQGIRAKDWEGWNAGTNGDPEPNRLFCRYFPDMAYKLTQGRGEYLPLEERLDAMRSANTSQQPEDLFALTHPFGSTSTEGAGSRQSGYQQSSTGSQNPNRPGAGSSSYYNPRYFTPPRGAPPPKPTNDGSRYGNQYSR